MHFVSCVFPSVFFFLSGRQAAPCHVVVSQELQAKRGDGEGDREKHEKYMIIMPPH